MKKILAILPAATLALTGCLSSSDDDSSASVVLPDDYIVTQMGEFVYEDGNWEITKATCTDYANEYVWKKGNQLGSLKAGDNNTAEIDFDRTGNKVAYNFKALTGENFPSGLYYKSSALKDPLIEGFKLEDPYYNEVVFVNTDCLFQHLGEMQETMAEIAKVPKNTVTMECKKISIQGLEMTYDSHTPTSINYTISYGGKSCPIKHEFRYAYNENECAAAFKDYQQEYANGETNDLFDFELYDQNISACSDFVDLITDFHNATGLAKSASESSLSEKQVKDILRLIGNRIRKGK
jgi:hypothetical protein